MYYSGVVWDMLYLPSIGFLQDGAFLCEDRCLKDIFALMRRQMGSIELMGLCQQKVSQDGDL